MTQTSKPPLPRRKPPKLKLLRRLRRPMLKRLDLQRKPPRLKEMQTRLPMLRRSIKLQRVPTMKPRKKQIL